VGSGRGIALHSHDLVTLALDGGGWSAPHRGRFTAGRNPVPNVPDAGWAPGPGWTCAKNLALPEFDPQTVQPVASRYTVRAIPALIHNKLNTKRGEPTILTYYDAVQQNINVNYV
jgi:hypothetical protein